MLRNYLKVAFRNLSKQRFYSLLNVLGLALGMACCLLILAHVRNELSYDRFHRDADQVYRLISRTQVQKQQVDYPMVGFPWAEILESEVPQVQAAVRIFGGANFLMEVEYEDQRYFEEQLVLVDSNFSEVFSLDVVQGDPSVFFRKPNQVVLTEATAQKYFGNADPLHKIIEVHLGPEPKKMEVVGVVKAYPAQAHFHFDLLSSMTTLIPAFGGPDQPIFKTAAFTSFYTYIRSTDAQAVSQQLGPLYNKYIDDESKAFLKSLYLQPLTDIHLHSNLIAEFEPNGNALFIQLLSFIAALTLIISCINFINLTTALSANRSKEVGLRKVVGARRINLIRQFFTESVLITLISVAFAVGLTLLIHQLIARSSGVRIQLDYLSDPFLWIVLSGITLFVALAAGSYPALFLSGFKPLDVLRGRLRSGAKSGVIRKALVILQFVISTTMIIGTFIFLKQLNYIQTMDMGFDRHWRGVLALNLDTAEERIQVAKRLKQRFEQHPDIFSSSATGSVPGQPRPISQVHVKGQPEESVHNPVTLSVDFDYIKSMGMTILEGRDFDPQYLTDSTEAILINEAAVRDLDLDAPVIGTEISYLANQFGQQVEKVRVIGVFQDIHFEPLYRTIHPMILRILPQQFFSMIVHFRPGTQESTLAFIESAWKEVAPDKDLNYTFLDEELSNIYKSEQELGKMVSLFAFLAIFIACLGLFGLSAYTTTQRRKEISVRKVLGASVTGLVGMLSKEFLLLVLIAFPIAAGLAWWITGYWLQTFAYQAAIGPAIYLLAGLITLAIAFFTVSYHSVKAANHNPVDALQRE